MIDQLNPQFSCFLIIPVLGYQVFLRRVVRAYFNTLAKCGLAVSHMALSFFSDVGRFRNKIKSIKSRGDLILEGSK